MLLQLFSPHSSLMLCTCDFFLSHRCNSLIRMKSPTSQRRVRDVARSAGSILLSGSTINVQDRSPGQVLAVKWTTPRASHSVYVHIIKYLLVVPVDGSPTYTDVYAIRRYAAVRSLLYVRYTYQNSNSHLLPSPFCFVSVFFVSFLTSSTSSPV